MPEFKLKRDSQGYYVRLYDPLGKVRQPFHRCMATTEEAAMAEVREWYADRLGNPFVPAAFEEFIQAKETLGAAAATIRAYRTRAGYLRPYLAKTRVRNLEPPKLTQIVESLLKSGSANGGPLSPNTVNYVITFGQGAYKWMLGVGYVTSNPFADVTRPRWSPHEAHPLDDEAIALLRDHLASRLDAQETDEDSARSRCECMAMYLALNAGLRAAEAAGLRWCDVLPRQRTVMVEGQIKEDGGLLRWEHGTKGRKSRQVPISEATAERIKAHRAWQRERFKVTKVTPLASCDGKPMRPNQISGSFRQLAAKLGLDDAYVFHNLRHTFATLSLQAGVPLPEVSAMLGHADTSVTAKVYAHYLPGRGDEAIRAFTDVLEGL